MVTSANAGLPRQSVGSDMNTRNISSGSWSESFTIMISVVHRVLGLPLASPVENMICTGAVTEMSFADAVPDKKKNMNEQSLNGIVAQECSSYSI